MAGSSEDPTCEQAALQFRDNERGRDVTGILGNRGHVELILGVAHPAQPHPFRLKDPIDGQNS